MDNASNSAGERLAAKYDIPRPAVIAHRGDSFHAPEETRPAYILAREEGADYLEADLQRTRDGYLIALHDTDLRRTTNVEDVFPKRADDPVSTFTLAEIKQLDAGSWFNKAFPKRARESFVGLKILTLGELLQIASSGDNQPGVYLETKAPDLFPGIEKDLAHYLRTHHWIGPNARAAPDGFNKDQHVSVGYSDGRVILQTFSKESLTKLNAHMPNTPKILLLWMGKGYIPADQSIKQKPNESDPAYLARMKVASHQAYDAYLDFAENHGAIGVGPSAVRADLNPTYSYFDLAKEWMVEDAHERGLLVHVYTLDDAIDFRRYFKRGVDGVFTNNPSSLLRFVGHAPEQTPEAILEEYGY